MAGFTLWLMVSLRAGFLDQCLLSVAAPPRALSEAMMPRPGLKTSEILVLRICSFCLFVFCPPRLTPAVFHIVPSVLRLNKFLLNGDL